MQVIYFFCFLLLRQIVNLQWRHFADLSNSSIQERRQHSRNRRSIVSEGDCTSLWVGCLENILISASVEKRCDWPMALRSLLGALARLGTRCGRLSNAKRISSPPHEYLVPSWFIMLFYTPTLLNSITIVAENG